LGEIQKWELAHFVRYRKQNTTLLIWQRYVNFEQEKHCKNQVDSEENRTKMLKYFVILFHICFGLCLGKENTLMVSYGPIVVMGLQGYPPPIVGIYKRTVFNNWDAIISIGDLNFTQNGRNSLDLGFARYFGESNSGLTIGASYHTETAQRDSSSQKVIVHSFPIGLGYQAQWNHIVHDVYFGYGPSFVYGRVSKMAAGRLGIGLKF
jgi:hypothetical protein